MILKALPTCVIPYNDIELPSRTQLLILIPDPIETKSITDMREPKRAIPNTLMLDAHLVNALNESADPHKT